MKVIPIDSAEISISICEGESFDGYSEEGVYTDNYTSQEGCDSIRTLDLDVILISESTILDTICEGESLEGYSTSGTYSDIFISELGCDSIRTLILEVLPLDHQDCIVNSNIDLISEEGFIYPNPFNETLYINENVNEISIYSIQGKLIRKESLFNSNILNLSHLQSGIYLVKLGFNGTIFTKTELVCKL